MRNFKKDGKKQFGGRSGGFGGFGGGRERDRGPVTMHQAVCAQCGRACEVPFRPSNSKPVYCKACFSNIKDGGDKRSSGRFTQQDFKSFKAPKSEESRFAGEKSFNDDVKRQLEMLNEKMERLIKAVEKDAKIAPLAVEKKTKLAEKKPVLAKTKKTAKKAAKK